ncbi:MAG: PHB depolymerase family esterase [Gammaproteobacteria bacterium]|nr:PHB depolymerase family esterase [Gammaproteobacteria bacterium]
MKNSYLNIRHFIAVLFVSCSFSATSNELVSLTDFGANPGQLTAQFYAAEQSRDLIVTLHGCGQSGVLFAENSGILAQSKLANVNVLIPQQNKENNSTLCFNWFSPDDQQKGQGESESIVNMIEAVKAKYKIARVFVVGLSAGGAMASNLLVNYPSLFTAGAVVAGIPFPCADDLVKAISCMKSGSSISAQLLAKKVYKDNSTWPALTVVTGKKDTIVNPINSEQMAEQWVLLNNTSLNKTTENKSDWQISRWTDAGVELIEVENMGHGFPIDINPKGNSSPAPFFHPNQISLAKYLLRKWIN